MQIVHSLTLQCIYSNKNYWRIDNLYTCTGTVVLDGDPRFITEVSQNHLEGSNNNNVLSVLIEKQLLGFIPGNISKFFPNLVSLAVNDCGVEEIERKDINQFFKLRQLHLNPNKISEIGNGLFEENKILKFITFSGNPVRHVAHNVFDDLNELEILDMEVTTCISQSNWGRDNISAFMFRLTVSCPPSFEMLFERVQRKLLKGNKLKQKIEDGVSERISTLLNQTQVKLETTDERLKQLERKLRNLSWLKEIFGIKN